MGECEVSLSAAVFLDRDGVINEVIVKNNVVFSPRTRDEFNINNTAAQAVLQLKASGYRVVVLTNQPDIRRGLLKQSDLDWMHEKIKMEVDVDDIIYCPHDDRDKCLCRKPKPGMIIQYAKKCKIDVSASYLIGDGIKDIEAANRAGCTAILMKRLYNKNVECDIKITSLMEAVDVILNHKRNVYGYFYRHK